MTAASSACAKTNNALKVTKDTVVRIEFRLADADGQVLDATDPGQPLAYLHGYEDLLPGMEEALEGRGAGEHVEVEIPPAKAFGETQNIEVTKIPRSSFPADVEIEPGMSFLLQTPEGDEFPAFVAKTVGAEVHVTPEHPLAGVTLRFDCTVVDVREATEDELRSGTTPDEGGGCGCC